MGTLLWPTVGIIHIAVMARPHFSGLHLGRLHFRGVHLWGIDCAVKAASSTFRRTTLTAAAPV